MSSENDFDRLENHELRRVIADLELQVEMSQALLNRALAEQRHRKQEKKEGIFHAVVVAEPNPSRPH